MNRAIHAWAMVGLLAVGLTAGGQPSSPPESQRPRTVRAVSGLQPIVALGRPIGATTARQDGVPGRLPAEVLHAPTLPQRASPLREAPYPLGEIIATSANIPHTLEPPLATDGPPSDEFASQRRPTQPPIRLMDHTIPPPVASAPKHSSRMVDMPDLTHWSGTYPVKGPPPEQIFAPPGYVVENVADTQVYFGAEYLLWWTKADRAPVLATTGSAFVNTPGALVDPNTPPPGALDTRIVQDGRLDHGTRSGMRLTAGWYLDNCTGKAIELSGFFLGQRSARFSTDQNEFPVLARPFFDTVTGRENVELVAFPGFADGRLIIDSPSNLWGLEANLICKACCGGDCGRQWRVNWLVGPRYLNLREGLTILEDIRPTNALDPLFGSQLIVTDRFATSNQFYGAQVGAEGRWLMGRLSLDGRVRVALGVTDQRVTIEGSQAILGAGNADPRPGGLLALPSNLGTSGTSRFAVVPELTGSVGYYVLDWMRLSVGYNFLYWSSVVRPGQQIDRNLNSNQIPNFNDPIVVSTAPPPRRLFTPTDYWAHGLTFGLEVHY